MAPDAGYSGTPLPRKLGVKVDELLLSQPDNGGLPGAGPLRRDLSGSDPLDVIVFFVTWRAELETRLGSLRERMAPACGLWIAWPKRAARVPTDMTEDVVRDVALPTGLVDNKVCAIDEVWSGLRLVIRRELRPPAG